MDRRASEENQRDELLQSAFARFHQLRQFIGWTEVDSVRVRSALPLVHGSFAELIDDFYATIEKNAQTMRVISGGGAQIERLKRTLLRWLEELFSGPYDADYVARRWKVGWRHVEVGLDQAYTNLALSRLRDGLIRAVAQRWRGATEELVQMIQSINRLLDLDLAIILDAYGTESMERQRQAERLRGEASFFRLVEAAGVMIVILRPDQSIVYANPFAETLTGYALSDLIGKDYVRTFVPPDQQNSLQGELRRILAGKAVRGYENSVLCRDQSSRWVVWNGQRLEEYQGGPALVLIGQDITVRKDVEERALRSERLAAIGMTVTGLAHESRNAFQRSQASLELLALELEGHEEQLKLVARIQRSLDHLHRLYEEVRDYAAPIKLDRQVCDLAHLWRDAWSHLEAAHSMRNVSLVEHTNFGDILCSVDWFAMGQVFRNIFENAIDACPTDTEVVVRCTKILFDGKPAWRISIRDRGTGIQPDARERVFDAFFTTKPKGTGLGLAIVRRIVEAHGGTIVIGPAAEGAEFVITLPI